MRAWSCTSAAVLVGVFIMVASNGMRVQGEETVDIPIHQPTTYTFNADEISKRQEEATKLLGIEKEVKVRLSDSIQMEFVLLPSGSFKMGCAKKEDARLRPATSRASDGWGSVGNEQEARLHVVWLTQPFYMGKYLVTRGQFAEFVNDTKYKTTAEERGYAFGLEDGKRSSTAKGYSWKKTGFEQTDDHPVVNVSWDDAWEFCKWASKKTGKTIQLPTEAQWEYACRAGTDTLYPWGDKLEDGKGWFNGLDKSAEKTWLKGAKMAKGSEPVDWDDGYPFTSPVGKFKPNAFGLYDIYGNVTVWVSDFYMTEYRGSTDPTGPDIIGGYNLLHVMRGGAWGGNPPVYARSGADPRGAEDTIGFRVMMVVSTPTSSPASQPASGSASQLATSPGR